MYQIYKYNPEHHECFESAGVLNRFPTLEQAQRRKEALDQTWNKYGTQYVIVREEA